jgi:tripartite-type tricarboxylate transporter receptor subunit TctC
MARHLRAIRAALLCLLLHTTVGTTQAGEQPYPDHPVKLVVPYTVGGPVDQLARLVAERLTTSMGQSFIVENKPGGNTIVAASMVARAKPDGYTLFVASSASLAVNPLVYERLPYDPAKDFTPVSMIGRAPLVMVVNAKVPANNVPELIEYIRSRNGAFAFASNGNGNPLHLACELFRTVAGVDMVHVPYNGTAPALASVIAGDTQMTCDILQNSLPQIKAGKVRAIGVPAEHRAAVLPSVPTMAEQGMAGADASVWFAVVAPAGTPAPIVDALGEHIKRAMADTALRARFAEMGIELGGSTPAELTAEAAKESAKWAPVIKRYGIKVQ